MTEKFFQSKCPFCGYPIELKEHAPDCPSLLNERSEVEETKEKNDLSLSDESKKTEKKFDGNEIDKNLFNKEIKDENNIGYNEEKSEKWKSVDQTVNFIKENWKGFFHTHAQEGGNFTPENEKNYIDLSRTFQNFLKMEYHGISPHIEKAYPEEIVINKGSIKWHKEKFDKKRKDRDRPEREIKDEAMERYLHLKEYHQPEKIHQSFEKFEKIDQEAAEKTLKGAECDIKIEETNDGSLIVNSFTPLEKIKEMNLDYLIFSIHPDTDPRLKEICDNDPDKLVEIYSKMASLAHEISEQQNIRTIIGHPLHRCEARRKFDFEQKEALIKNFAQADVPIEIGLGDYYMAGASKKIKTNEGEKIIKGEEKILEESVPEMDKNFLELIKKYNLKISLETDLHFGNWVKHKGGMEKIKEELKNLYEKPSFLSLPGDIRAPIARFVKSVQRVLKAGIKPENIINTWDKEKIKKIN